MWFFYSVELIQNDQRKNFKPPPQKNHLLFIDMRKAQTRFLIQVYESTNISD